MWGPGVRMEKDAILTISLVLCVSSKRFKDSAAIPLVISCLETIVKHGRSICAISKCLELDLLDNKLNFAV